MDIIKKKKPPKKTSLRPSNTSGKRASHTERQFSFQEKKVTQQQDFSFDNTASSDPLFPTHFPKSKKQNKFKKGIKIMILGLLLVFATVVLFATYSILKIHKINQKVVVKSSQENLTIAKSARSIITSLSGKNQISLNGEDQERINILLLGIAGEGKPGTNLTDTIMIASINTKTNKIGLLSLPRDLYVEVPEFHHKTKINSVYQFGINQDQGIDPLTKTVENITDLTMHYYVILNFDGFEKIIDDVGGITVNNERDIYDPRYPGPNYSYELFELKKGTHALDGKTALKYARQRHGDPEGDFGRAKRQQQVIQAFKNKVFSARTLLNIITVNKMLNTLDDNIKTNIQIEEIGSFIELIKKLDTQNINNTVVDAWKKDSLLRVSHVYYPNSRMFILVPRTGNFKEVQDLSKNIFELEKIQRRKKEIEKEDAKIAIVNYTDDLSIAKKMRNLLKEGLGFESITVEKNISTPRFVPQKTTIFDTNSGQTPFSLDELIKKIPAITAQNHNSSNIDQDVIQEYDLIVVVGEDIKNFYDYNENVIENMSEEEYDEMYSNVSN